MFGIGLYKEKRLDLVIIPLDFGLEEILSSIFKVEQGPPFT